MEIIGKVYYDETSPTLLRWSIDTGGKRKVGDVAGHFCKASGYVYVTYRGNKYPVQYVVWALHGRDVPKGFVLDHINTIRDDNNITNLRIGTNSQNNMNKSVTSRSTTGVKGLTYHTTEGRWYGTVTVQGTTLRKKSKDRGVVEAWLKETRERLHGEYSRE